MKKFKKIIYYSLVPIIIIAFILSFKTYLSISNFSTENIKNNISYISSDKFEGRLCGTEKNKEAGKYIEKQFKEIGLDPLNNSYTESFNVLCPKTIKNESPYLIALDKDNKVIKKFEYGVDYKEEQNFRNNSVEFAIENCQILPSSPNTMKVYQNDYMYLFFVPNDVNLNFRYSFVYESSASMLIMLTQKSYNEIKTFLENGCSIKCYIPIKLEKSTAENIVGVLKGQNPELPPIVLAAHFDHVGIDFDNNVYNGALDNASGTSYIIEMARYLKNIGTPNRDVIFAALNGEEFGFRGAAYFAKKHKNKIKDGKVFNFDMVGGNESAPLCIVGGYKDTSKTDLIKEISEICSKQHLYFNYIFEDSSDHYAFRELGIDAVTLCDKDESRIHTPEDKAQYINTQTIKRCYKASSPEILRYCYGNNILIFHYKGIMLICIAASIVLLVIKKWDCI